MLICYDADDPLERKCLRAQLNVDKDRVLIDLPRKFAGDGSNRYTEVIVERSLDKQEALALAAWLQRTAEVM